MSKNDKHPIYTDELLPENTDLFKPDFKRDSRGRYFMQLPGYGKWMVGVEPGSKIITQGSENEAGGPATSVESLHTGTLSAETVISVGDSIYLDGGAGCIYVGDFEKRIGPSISICSDGIKGYAGSDLVFGFFLEKEGDFEVGDVLIGGSDVDNYVLWDDSDGTLTVKGSITASSGYIGGWLIDTCLKSEFVISSPSMSKIELCPGNPGHVQVAYSPTGVFSIPGDVDMIQMTQGSTADAGGTPIPRVDIYKSGTKRVMLNSDGLYFFDSDGTTINNKIELTQATLKNVLIEGGAIAANSEPSIQGWSHNITFSSTDYNTASWGSGSIKLTNGDTFSISAGNTGNMSTTTYIYLDKGTSTTVLQTTTNATTSIGSGKILIAVAKNNADSTSDATFQVFGGKGGMLLIADNIAANTITSNEIHSNTITTNELIFTPYVIGTNNIDDIDDGTTYGKILNTSISAGKITLSAAIGDLDDISDGTYGKILTTDISSGHILLSASVGNLDDIDNGTTYSKVATTSISAGKIILTSGTGVSGSLPIGNTDADITGDNTSADTSAINGVTSSIISGWRYGSTTYINGGDIYTGTITANKIDVTYLDAVAAYCGDLIVGGSGDAYGTLSVRDSGNNEIALLNQNAIITRHEKPFSAESSSSGTYTQFYTSGMNGIIEITSNSSGTFGIKDDDSSHYIMKWSYYDIQSFKTFLPDVNGSRDLGSSSLKWDDVFCNTMKGLYGEIYLDQSGRIQVTNHLDPSGTGSYNLGGATRYWDWVTCNNINKKTGGGTGWLWLDNGVELQDGRLVSDVEAINNMKLLVQINKDGEEVETIDPKTLPKVIFKPARDHEGNLYPRDENDKAYELDENKNKVEIYDGEDVFATISLLIGSVKELSTEIKALKAKIN